MKSLQIWFLLFWLFSVCSLFASFFVQDEWTKVFDVSPGDTVNQAVQLYNPSDRVVNVRVYQSDYITNDSGEDVYLPAGSYHRSNADWIRVQSSIRLQPNQTFPLPFLINVPTDRDLKGSYWSDLLIEEVIETTDFDPEIIAINLRYAIQIICNVVNTEQIQLAFENIHYGVDEVSLSLRNTGNSWFQASIKMDVYDDRAELVGSFLSERNRVYPSAVKRVHIPVRLSRFTNYYAIIVADCGNGNIFGHQVSFIITTPDTGQ